ncbi:MAG: hypothetical protein IT320_19335 [Anaerolineae bacterium]|nr:hypothetical protein [Anaerolineae bacterium]
MRLPRFHLRYLWWVLIVIATLLAAGVLLFAWTDTSVPFYFALTTIVYFYLSAIFLIIGLALLIAIPINLVRLVIREKALFGWTARARILSFGLATILFATVLAPLVFNLITFFVELLRRVPGYLSDAWRLASLACGSNGTDLGECFSVAGFGFFNSWVTAFWDAFSRNLKIDTELVIAIMGWLVVWVLVAQVLNFLEPITASDAQSQSRFSLWLKARKPAHWQNFALVLVLALGAYLSLVAIVAIPALRPDVSPGAEDITGTTLSTQLRLLAESQSVAPPYDPTESEAAEGDNDPFEPLTTFIAEHPEAAFYAQSTLDGVKSMRTYGIQELDQLQVFRDTVQASDLARAAETFTIRQQTRLGNRENAEYYLQLVDWYMGHIDQMNDAIVDCSRALTEADAAWSTWADSAKTSLAAVVNQTDETIAAAITPLPAPPADVASLIRAECIEPRLADDPMPDRPTLGAYWGPLGTLAVWVLESETMPLALIVGMVGFGVLGAATSTIIREKLESLQNPPPANDGVVVRDLFGVLVRGISSAVVVFLAAEGGLSILAVEETEPNPYALLLLCLIAAVFSEAVWDWAQKWLGERLGAARAPGSELIPLDDDTTEEDETVDTDDETDEGADAGQIAVDDIDPVSEEENLDAGAAADAADAAVDEAVLPIDTDDPAAESDAGEEEDTDPDDVTG